jgi:Ala-tRNA(Pro) deacylase
MATAVKKDEAKTETFLAQRDALVTQLRQAFPGRNYTIQETVESVDVHAAHAGKQAGPELIYEWLQRVSDITHDEFMCFGDSKGDYEMARWFAEQGLQTRFVYTGTELELADPHDGVEVIDTSQLYTAGTLEYLHEVAKEKRQPIFDLLAELQIDYRLQEHRAVYTVAESSDVLPDKVPVKTLLVTDDKKSHVWMVAMRGDVRLDMKELAKVLGAKKLQFVRAERVEEIVGVPPGSVSIFGLLHPGSHDVHVIVDEALMNEKEIGFHPQDNTATVFIRPSDLAQIVDATCHKYRILAL